MPFPRVRVREVFKLIEHHNPISGHRWHNHGETTGYQVVGPYGVISHHRTHEAAHKAADAWIEYYERHP